MSAPSHLRPGSRSVGRRSLREGGTRGPIPRDISIRHSASIFRPTTSSGYGFLPSQERRQRTPPNHSPEHPWRELGAAEIEALALGRLTGGGLEHQVENPLA